MVQGIETLTKSENPQVKTFRYTWARGLSVENHEHEAIPTVSEIESMLQEHLGPSAILLRWAIVETVFEKNQRQWIIEGAYLSGPISLLSSESPSTIQLA